jgi:hypothetical protein
MAEFLPVSPTDSFVTLRHRTLILGKRLDEKAREREWFDPPQDCEQRQIELDLPDDPERGFVVSIDTAHVRGSAEVEGRTFEIAVARCGCGGRGSRPGHYFVTADTSKRDMRSRTLQALQHEVYAGRSEVTVLSDGAEILKGAVKLTGVSSSSLPSVAIFPFTANSNEADNSCIQDTKIPRRPKPI